jgi:putative peptidoglycan lipid II flippase
VHVLTRAFYAMQDTRTPVAWAIVAVAINVPLMIALVGPMGVEGLALALSISSVLEVVGLLWALRGRIDSVEEGAIARSLGRSAVAGGVAAVVMLGGLAVIDAVLAEAAADPLGRVAVLFGVAGAGTLAFLGVAALLGSVELEQLRAILRRRTRTAA